MALASGGHNLYKKVDVETASQGKLIVMLLNGAIQRASEGKRAILEGQIDDAHENLVRAQNIITELRSALNFDMGEIATNLDRSYEYLHHLLVQANVKKDGAFVDECVEHLGALRDTWEELFRRQDAEEANTPAPAPRINPHGSSVINIKG